MPAEASSITLTHLTSPLTGPLTRIVVASMDASTVMPVPVMLI